MAAYTQSELRARRTCERLAHYKYVELRRPRKTDNNLHLGKVVHAAVDVWWDTRDGAAVKAFIEGLEDIEDSDRAKVLAMMSGYVVSHVEDGIEQISNGRKFQVPITEEDEFWGEIDGLVHKGDQLYIRETKTSGAYDIGIGSDYYARLRMDSQHQLYMWAMRQEGMKVDGVLYDVIRKPRNRVPKSGDMGAYRDAMLKSISGDLGAYYARYIIPYDEAVVEMAVTDARETIATRQGRLRNDGACYNFMRLCEFFDVCTGVLGLDDDTVYETKTAKHEELK